MLSFIVPAHNEEALIGRTLAALHDAARALGEPYEIIVADDASTDRTADIARERGARVVSVNRRQIAAARNAGAKVATGDRFIFVDADTLVSPQVLRAAMRALRRGVVGGGCLFRFDGEVPLYIDLLRRLAGPVCRAIALCGGCFLFCTRKAFLAAAGFDETVFAAEELFFAQRLKRQGRFVVLPEFVTTSGRKARDHSAWELLSPLARIAWRGRKSVCRRDGLEIWYGPRATTASGEPGA
jgi:glycosyltransferase involved in cell wall biosynthesis